MIRDKIPLLLDGFPLSLITLWAYHKGEHFVPFHGGSPFINFLAMANVFVEYIICLILPVYLDNYYLTPAPKTIWEAQVLLSLAAIPLLALLAWFSYKRNRIFLFWLAWFFVSLLPVLNIVPIAILRADRYLYLPAVGFFLFIGSGFGKGRPEEAGLFLPSLGFSWHYPGIGSYAFLTVERNHLWRDHVHLWEDNFASFPTAKGLATPSATPIWNGVNFLWLSPIFAAVSWCFPKRFAPQRDRLGL